MATTITFHLVATPDGTTSPVLDVVNTYTMSDADSERMLAAYTDMFTPRLRPGPRQTGVVITPPTPDVSISRVCDQLWTQLKAPVDSYYTQKATQAAQATVTPVGATKATQVNAMTIAPAPPVTMSPPVTS